MKKAIAVILALVFVASIISACADGEESIDAAANSVLSEVEDSESIEVETNNVAVAEADGESGQATSDAVEEEQVEPEEEKGETPLQEAGASDSSSAVANENETVDQKLQTADKMETAETEETPKETKTSSPESEKPSNETVNKEQEESVPSKDEEEEPQTASEAEKKDGVRGDSVTIPDHEETVGNLVWVPVNGGTKYHSNPNCSKMKDPMQVSVETAEANGYEPCKRCY